MSLLFEHIAVTVSVLIPESTALALVVAKTAITDHNMKG